MFRSKRGKGDRFGNVQIEVREKGRWGLVVRNEGTTAWIGGGIEWRRRMLGCLTMFREREREREDIVDCSLDLECLNNLCFCVW